MKTTTLLLLAIVGGCSKPPVRPQIALGPSSQDEEEALEIVWEGVLGLTVDQRPKITWWLGCPGGQDNTGCFDEYSTPGNVSLIWVGENPSSGQVLAGERISDTHFSAWLEGQWEFIEYPATLAPGALADAKVRKAQQELVTAGL